jgi:hypothetical protein
MPSASADFRILVIADQIENHIPGLFWPARIQRFRLRHGITLAALTPDV